MKWSILPSLTLASLLHVSPLAAYQQGNTGNALLTNCSEAISGTATDTTGFSYCYGVVRGATFVLDETVFCLPQGVTLEQLVRMIVPYMKARPAYLHNDQEWFIIGALTEAFPCAPKAK